MKKEKSHSYLDNQFDFGHITIGSPIRLIVILRHCSLSVESFKKLLILFFSLVVVYTLTKPKRPNEKKSNNDKSSTQVMVSLERTLVDNNNNRYFMYNATVVDTNSIAQDTDASFLLLFALFRSLCAVAVAGFFSVVLLALQEFFSTQQVN